MNIKKMLMDLADEGRALAQKAKDNPDQFTDADAARADEIVAEHTRLKGLLDRQADVSAKLAAVDAGETHEPDAGTGDEVKGKSIGERFVGSTAYKSFRKQHPAGIGPGTPVDIRTTVGKALNTEDLGIAGQPAPRWTDDLVYRPQLRFLDLITTGTTAESFLPYRQVISKTNNASIVAEAKDDQGVDAAGGLKPISTLTTAPADAKAHTYADGMEVTNQELADDGAIKALIDSTLTGNLYAEIERVLLNGAGTADEPAGLLNTSGVQQQDFAVDMVITIRKAKTRLVNNGTRIQAVVLNPEDDEAWDLLKDGNGRFLGNGPFGSGPATAWAVPRIASPAVAVGTAVMGDFSTIHLLIREALKILAFNQHKDYAQRNLNYIRAELRALQLFRAPGRIVIADLTAA